MSQNEKEEEEVVVEVEDGGEMEWDFEWELGLEEVEREGKEECKGGVGNITGDEYEDDEDEAVCVGGSGGEGSGNEGVLPDSISISISKIKSSVFS